MVFFSMVTIKVVCQVGSLLDTYGSQCTQIYHSFTVYLKGAKDSKSKHIYGRDNQKSDGEKWQDFGQKRVRWHLRYLVINA